MFPRGAARMFVALVGLAPALVPAAARANGRPPAINGAAVDPRDPRRIVLGGTFGPVFSKDCGTTWRWTCEQSVGYMGVFDPKFVFSLQSNAIFATTFNGLTVTRDEGCSWTFVDTLKDFFVDDVLGTTEMTADGTPRQLLWALTSSAARRNCVFESSDDGATWQEGGLCSDTLFFKTLAVAPSDPQQLYATGYNPGMNVMRPTFHRSKRRDASGVMQWETLELPAALWPATDLRVVGVDKASPSRVYLRGKDSSGALFYTSNDGGVNWQKVALAPEITQITAAVIIDEIIYITTNLGLYKSTDHAASFQVVPGAPQMHCLSTVMTTGADHQVFLYGCSNPFTTGAAALISRDLTNFTPIFKFDNLYGPLECPGGTPATDVCTPLYPGLAMQLFSAGSTPVPGLECGQGAPPGSDAGPERYPDPPARVDGGMTSATRDGGAVVRSSGGCDAAGEAGAAGALGGGLLCAALAGLSAAARSRRRRRE